MCARVCTFSSLLFSLVSDRMAADGMYDRHWWWRRGVVFKRTLPAFNGELIVGSDADGLRAPGSLLRPMIKFVTFKYSVKASDHVLSFSTLCTKNVEQRGVLPICFELSCLGSVLC